MSKNTEAPKLGGNLATLNPKIVEWCNRIAALKADRKAINADITAMFEAARAEGINTDALKAVMKLKESDPEVRTEYVESFGVVADAVGLQVIIPDLPGTAQAQDQATDIAGDDAAATDGGGTEAAAPSQEQVHDAARAAGGLPDKPAAGKTPKKTATKPEVKTPPAPTLPAGAPMQPSVQAAPAGSNQAFYDEGRKARADGKALSTNPGVQGSIQFVTWEEGWKAEDEFLEDALKGFDAKSGDEPAAADAAT